MGGQCHTSATLPPGKRPGTYHAGGCVGLRARLNGYKKFRPPRFELWTIQPIESHYTEYTKLANTPYRIEVLKVLTQLQFSVWNISFYEVPVLLISTDSREGYTFSISEACSALKRLIINKWIIPDDIFHILLPHQQQTLCAVLILGDILLRKDDSLKETSPSTYINTHAM